tara:strand:- start:1451 stop:1825 length:375 start_codon:yes stop_codon:yes gene_type:complete
MMGEMEVKMTQDQLNDLKEKITMIKSGTKVSQIMVSRIVKSPRSGGDVFLSMTANYGNPTDTDDSEMLSLEDAKIASHILAKEVNVLAHEQAAASGLITLSQAEMANKKVKGNFSHLIAKLGEK